MMTLNETWTDLLTVTGLLNPIALVIGLYLGRKADAFSKIWIAAFAAAALSLIAETGWKVMGLPSPFLHDAGALAMFPFRFIGGGLAAAFMFRFFSERKK